MRWSVGLYMAFCACCASIATAEESFPYVGYIDADSAAVHGGPGTDFYATDRLERGSKLEVYRHDPGGWLAVRPPAGSFSWVAAGQLRMTNNEGIAEVAGIDVAAWIGSRVGDVRELRWQVRLEEGELVEVLGVKRFAATDNDAVETYYKVAPPAGEFRWVRARDVNRQPLEEVADLLAERPLDVIRDGQTRRVDFQKPADAQTGGASESSDGFVARGTSKTATKRTTPTSKNANATAPTSSAAATVRESTSLPTETGVDDFDTQLSKVDIELSLMVARDPQTWQLTTLRKQTETLVEAGKSSTERGRARLLLDRVRDFENLQLRSDDVAPSDRTAQNESSLVRASDGAIDDMGTANTDVPKGKVAGTGPSNGEPDDTIDPKYDGSGWLMPVHSQNRTAPLYALLNDDGKVLHYISPAPGLNLHRYLRQEVGIRGQRGYIEKLQTPHLTAERVIVLDRHR